MLYLPVQDQDSPFTAAWRTQFHILGGNEEEHFDIMTDPETNQGVLNVIKVKSGPGGVDAVVPVEGQP